MATYKGTSGDDSYTGGADADFLYGRAGNDALDGAAGDDRIEGGAGDDVLTGGAGLDLLYGGGGDDTVIVQRAADHVAGEIIDGGSGYDRLDLLKANDVDVSAWSWTGIEEVRAYTVRMSAAQLAGLTAVDASSLVLTTGGTIDAAGVSVTAEYVTLADEASLLDLRAADWAVLYVLGGDGDDIVHGSDTFQQLSGGGGDDVLVGGSQGGRLYGGSGDDVLTGGAGNEIISGEGGVDVIDCGGGDDKILLFYKSDHEAGDTYDGGAGFDQIELGYFSGSTDISDWSIANVESILSFKPIIMTAEQAGAFDEIRASRLVLSTGGTADLRGALIEPSEIVLSDAGNTLILTGQAAHGFAVTGRAGDDGVAGSTLADTLAGRAGDDVLDGAGGDDLLDGGRGKDVLTGGAGRDVMTGGAGRDLFRFDEGDLATGRDTADRITDFATAQGDRIDLRRIDAIPGGSGDDAFTFIGTAAFSGAAGELRYAVDGPTTWVEADQDGDGVADGFVAIDGAVTLTAADLIL